MSSIATAIALRPRNNLLYGIGSIQVDVPIGFGYRSFLLGLVDGFLEQGVEPLHLVFLSRFSFFDFLFDLAFRTPDLLERVFEPVAGGFLDNRFTRLDHRAVASPHDETRRASGAGHFEKIASNHSLIAFRLREDIGRYDPATVKIAGVAFFTLRFTISTSIALALADPGDGEENDR